MKLQSFDSMENLLTLTTLYTHYVLYDLFRLDLSFPTVPDIKCLKHCKLLLQSDFQI